MLDVKTASTHPVTHVVFHPNDGSFAVAQPHSGVTLCERSSGQALRTVPVARVGEFASVCLFAGGAKLAVSSHKGVSAFDLATGALLGHGRAGLLGNALLAERGDALLAVSLHGISTITLPEAGFHRLGTLPVPLSARAGLVALSPCGRWGFGVYSRANPALVELATGRAVAAIAHPFRNTGSAFPGVCFAANGSRFAVCDGIEVSVYHTPEPEAEAEADDEEGDAPDATVPTAPKPRPRLQPVFRLPPPDDYHPAPPRPSRQPRFADERNRPAGAWRPPMAFTPDGRALLVRRPRNRVQLWDVATGTLAGEWSWRLEWVTCLAVAFDGLTAVAGGRFGRAVMWDLE